MSAQQQVIDLDIVGGTNFGRYKKQSVEQTFNMIKAGDALVPYAGYKKVLTLSSAANATGRGIYKSSRANILLSVIGGAVIVTTSAIDADIVGTLETTSGRVYMAENNNNQILISDELNLYIYDYTSPGSFSISNYTAGFDVDFTPGAVDFQNGRFTAAAKGTSTWRLSDFNDGLEWPLDVGNVGSLSTKPDEVMMAKRFPGNGNLLFLFGKTVSEQWTDVGASDFPYQKSSNFNVDFGVANAATIASLDNFVVWLAVNEKSGPTIRYSNGGQAQKISNDGLDFQFSRLVDPTDSYGFLFQQDGHILYQITFLTDNLSYVYDFTSEQFSTVTDENLGNHIARDVVFFNNKYYFVAFTDGNLYEFGTNFSTFDYGTRVDEIPRIRITAPKRMKGQEPFVLNEISFGMEQGQRNIITDYSSDALTALITEDGGILVDEHGDVITTEAELNFEPTNYIVSNMVVDFSISIDGGYTFIGNRRMPLNATGYRQNIMKADGGWGRMNDLTVQIRFYGLSHFVAFNGNLVIES